MIVSSDNVPKALVYTANKDVDPIVCNIKLLRGKSKRKKGSITPDGTNWVFYVDGLGKLMGFKNSTLQVAIYSCLDTASTKLVWIKVWDSNSSPYLLACWSFHY